MKTSGFLFIAGVIAMGAGCEFADLTQKADIDPAFVQDALTMDIALSAQTTNPYISDLRITDETMCSTQGVCDLSFQVNTENGTWNKKQIEKKADSMNKDGSNVYHIKIETVPYGFKGSLRECLDNGVCEIIKNRLSFRTHYSAGGWYDVDVTLHKHLKNKDEFSNSSIHHSTMLHRPICMYTGTRSEGWYWEDKVAEEGLASLITYAFCKKAENLECRAIGSKSEGWYALNWTNTNNELQERILWDQCHNVAGYALTGEKCGPEIGQKCFYSDNECIDGICQFNEKPACAVWEVTGIYEIASYARNFHRASDAKEFLETIDASYFNVFEGTCREYAENNPVLIELWAPVCGTPIDEEKRTFHVVDSFRNYIMTKAGDEGESKGTYFEGECDTFCLYYETTDSLGTPLNNIYFENFRTYDEAKEHLVQVKHFRNELITETNCLQYAARIPYVKLWAPVCTNYPVENAQYPNMNEFKRAVAKDAGTMGGNKGHFEIGVCPEIKYCLSYIATDNEGNSLPEYHAYTVSSKEEAGEILFNAKHYTDDQTTEGSCSDRPMICPMYYQPVCGIYGSDNTSVTHGNICGLKVSVNSRAGKNGKEYATWTMGECPVQEEPVCLVYERKDGVGGYIQYAENYPAYDLAKQALATLDHFFSEDILTGTCGQIAPEMMCTMDFDPVCTADGNQFGNFCELRTDLMKQAGDDAAAKSVFFRSVCTTFCLTYHTQNEDGTPTNNFYAINTATYGEATYILSEQTDAYGGYASAGNCASNVEMCPQISNPVCGEISSEQGTTENTTFSNECYFWSKIKETAGEKGSAKGHFELGECMPSVCTDYRYVAYGRTCDVIRYRCFYGEDYFRNEKGCGCKREVSCK